MDWCYSEPSLIDFTALIKSRKYQADLIKDQQVQVLQISGNSSNKNEEQKHGSSGGSQGKPNGSEIEQPVRLNTSLVNKVNNALGPQILIRPQEIELHSSELNPKFILKPIIKKI